MVVNLTCVDYMLFGCLVSHRFMCLIRTCPACRDVNLINNVIGRKTLCSKQQEHTNIRETEIFIYSPEYTYINESTTTKHDCPSCLYRMYPSNDVFSFHPNIISCILFTKIHIEDEYKLMWWTCKFAFRRNKLLTGGVSTEHAFIAD